MTPFSCKFGELEAILADLHDIPSASRTAFQARLKNYHRLGFPKDIGSGRGKAVVYGIGDLVQMAVIVEMTQLGLSPERAIKVYEADEYPVLMAVNMAARALIGAHSDTFHPDRELPDQQDNPLSMFLYFDPAALSPNKESVAEDWASATFFYAGAGIVRENLTRWTTRQTRRLSLINVTALLWDLSAWIEEGHRDEFFTEICHWADGLITCADFDLDQWLLGRVRRAMTDQAANPVDPLLPKPDEWGWIKLPDLLEKAALMDADGGPLRVPEYGEASPERLFELPEQDESMTMPDMIINLPGQRQLFVDAKVIPAVDIAADIIAQRVEELAQQPYAGQFTDITKYVVLYLPGTQFFTDATREDKRIWEWAFDQKVIIATPATMVTILKEAEAAHAAAAAWEGQERTPAAQSLTQAILSGPGSDDARDRHGDNQKA